MEKVVIVSGTRTPIGKYKGALADFSAIALGEIAAIAAIKQAKIPVEDIGQVIIGNVLSAGSGQNIARQIAINSGIPVTTPATTLNEVCGSGMKSVILALQQIQLGEADVVLAGGTESMTQAPLVQQYQDLSDRNISWNDPVSTMITDGLTDAFSNQHMGLTAEKVAQKFHISREEQDTYALTSQQKAAQARQNGKFDKEITPVQLANGELFTQDEGIRENSSMEKLAALTPAFQENGTVTAGNASTINDGAAMLVLASKTYADAHQLPYLATIEGYSEIGMDPSIMGIAPVYAIEKLLQKTRLNLEAIDLFEINEAFAAASLAVEKQLALPKEKVNIYGGGISLGHPIGASGARILTTLIAQLQQEDKNLGLASLCVGGGIGLAMLLKRNTESPTDKKFYKMTQEERLDNLVKRGILNPEEANFLREKMSLDEDVANNMIENQIGQFELPLGCAQNFVIDNQHYVIPMATEEPSVIAAASNAAKIVAGAGGFRTETLERLIKGQIVFWKLGSLTEDICQTVREREKELLAYADTLYPSIVKRGGGVQEISTYIRNDATDTFLTIVMLIDTGDAMGANIINTILEGVAAKLQEWFPTIDKLFAILSNLPTEALVEATCQIPFSQLATENLSGQAVAEKIIAASAYAKVDPFRAATHNKGILNGVDAVVLATGNDTRAVAAGCHAYAVRTACGEFNPLPEKKNSYQGLSDWEIDDDDDETLIGTLTLPLAVGTVGGATKVLPKARIALSMLGNPDACRLAEIITAVGLAQNLAALKALVTEGIQKGHMNLHMRTLAISAGAVGDEIEEVAQLLQQAPSRNLELAQKLLTQMRGK